MLIRLFFKGLIAEYLYYINLHTLFSQNYVNKPTANQRIQKSHNLQFIKNAAEVDSICK